MKKEDKKILVIKIGHRSLCDELSDAYIKGAANAKIAYDVVALESLDFDPILHSSSTENQYPEEDLEKVQEKIEWANHLVLIYPTWWGVMPALHKGFLDRAFTPGFAYQSNSKNNKKMPEKLLKGKTAFVVTTTSGPWFHNLFIGNAGLRAFKRHIFSFCGIKTKTKLLNKCKHVDKKRFEKLQKKFFDYGFIGK